jgi:hypothetical protein
MFNSPAWALDELYRWLLLDAPLTAIGGNLRRQP